MSNKDKTETATTANNILTVSDNSNQTCYIPFSKTTANASTALFVDDTTTPLTYNPNTNTLTATTFNGNATTSTTSTSSTTSTTATTATTANNILLTSDNSNGNYYIPFSKTTANASTALFLDDTTTPLT